MHTIQLKSINSLIVVSAYSQFKLNVSILPYQREIEEKDAETKRKVQESCELSMKEKRRAVDDEPEHRGHHRSRREENLRVGYVLTVKL